MPKLSVIIPTYNSAKTIGATLNSIQQQHFKNIEIVIVDGLSQDGTQSIIDAFQQSSTSIEIKFVSERDNGIYDAMNKAIAMANGEWLYFLGSDDYFYDPQVLANVFDSHDNDNFDVIYGDVLSTRFGGRYDGEFDISKLYSQNICHQAIFLRKRVFEIVGLFETRFSAHADWDHNWKWFVNPDIKRKYINQVIAFYSDGGFSSVNHDQSFSKVRFENFYRHGKKWLSSDMKRRITLDLAIDASKRKQYLKFLKYKTLFWLNKYA